jgi:hypothetical protein
MHLGRDGASDPARLAQPQADQSRLAEAILLALNMPLGERKERWTAMMKVLARNDITAWRERHGAMCSLRQLEAFRCSRQPFHEAVQLLSAN